MSSLQAALPEAELSSTFLGGATQSWFPQNTVTPFIPAAAQGKCLRLLPLKFLLIINDSHCCY